MSQKKNFASTLIPVAWADAASHVHPIPTAHGSLGRPGAADFRNSPGAINEIPQLTDR